MFDGTFDIQKRRGIPQFPVQAGHTVLDRINFLGLQFFHGDAKGPQHGINVKVHQHGALKKKGVFRIRPSGAGNFAPLNFDVVSRAEIGFNAESGKRC